MKVYGANAETYWFINDHLGAPRTIVNSSGQVVWQAAYLPFGKAEVLVDTVENNFRLPGQYYDAETGLHYNMFRYYDPDTGRYITADPIGLDGGLNLFLYAGGDPMNWVDPWGLVSAGQLGIGNPGSYGGSNTCESMYDELSLEAYRYSSDWLMPSHEEMMEMLPIGGIGKAAGVGRASLKRLKKLIKKHSKPTNSGLNKQKLNQLERVVNKAGGKIRVDLEGVKGTGVRPHAHVEGLGSKIESRHIWLD